VKFKNNGDLDWARTFGGSDHDSFVSVVAVADGFVAVGESDSTDIDGITNKGGNDAIIVKFDNNGTVIWAKTFGGSDNDSFNSVIAVEGGLIAVGGSDSNDGDMNGLNKGHFSAIIVKLVIDDSNDNGGGNSGDDDNNSLILIVAIVAVAIIAGVLVYMFVLRPRK